MLPLFSLSVIISTTLKRINSTTTPIYNESVSSSTSPSSTAFFVVNSTTDNNVTELLTKSWEMIENELLLFSQTDGTNVNSTVPRLTAPPIAVLIVTACCLLLTFCIVGNLLVILSFANEPALQVITNYWIVSLSFTDIILATTVMPVQMTRELFDGKWTFGPWACDVFICMDVLCCTCSIYHLCLISLDRYFCVRFPFAYPQIRTKRATIIAIVCTWCVCIVISLPRLIGWKDAQPDDYACIMTNKVYMVFSSVLSFYFPLFLICCMYLAIYRTTHARSKKFSNRYPPPPNEQRLLRHAAVKGGSGERFAEEMSVAPMVGFENAVTAVRGSDESSTGDHNNASAKSSVVRNSESAAIVSTFFAVRFLQSVSLQALLAHSLTFDTLDENKNNKDDEQQPTAAVGCAGAATNSNSTSHDKSTNLNPRRFRPFFTIPSASDLRKRNQLNQAKLNRRRQKQEHRAAKVVVIVLAAFVLLWAPFFLVNIIGPLCDTCVISDDVWKLVTWLGYCNSAVNPAIYTFFNRTFRRAIIDVCRKCRTICCKKF